MELSLANVVGQSNPSCHPLFYYPFIPNPLLPRSTTEITTRSPSMTSNVSTTSVSSNQPQQQISSNFSINKILESPPELLATNHSPNMPFGMQQKSIIDTANMLWLHQMACTQNSLTPRVSLDYKRVTKKRKLGRNPRIPFTQQQIDCLERKYSHSRYLSSLDVVALSKELDLSEARVKIWFQNRRARERRDKRIELPLSESQASSSTRSLPATPKIASSPPQLWSPPAAISLAMSRQRSHPSEEHNPITCETENTDINS